VFTVWKRCAACHRAGSVQRVEAFGQGVRHINGEEYIIKTKYTIYTLKEIYPIADIRHKKEIYK